MISCSLICRRPRCCCPRDSSSGRAAVVRSTSVMTCVTLSILSLSASSSTIISVSWLRGRRIAAMKDCGAAVNAGSRVIARKVALNSRNLPLRRSLPVGGWLTLRTAPVLRLMRGSSKTCRPRRGCSLQGLRWCEPLSLHSRTGNVVPGGPLSWRNRRVSSAEGS